MTTTEDLQSWLQQDTTKYFFKSLYNQREILKEQLSAGYQGGDFIRGKIAEILSIINTDPEEITEDFINTVEKYCKKEKATEEEEEEKGDSYDSYKKYAESNT